MSNYGGARARARPRSDARRLCSAPLANPRARAVPALANVEFFGGLLVAAGAFTRPAALALAATMGLAVTFHLDATGLQGAPFGHVPNYS